MVKNKFFEEIKGNFGFGMMRLPMNGEEVDYEDIENAAECLIKKIPYAGFCKK